MLMKIFYISMILPAYDDNILYFIHIIVIIIIVQCGGHDITTFQVSNQINLRRFGAQTMAKFLQCIDVMES